MKLFYNAAMLTCLFGSYTLHGAQAQVAVQPHQRTAIASITPSALYPLAGAALMAFGLTPNSKFPTRFRASEETQWLVLFAGCTVLIWYLRKLSKQAKSLQDTVQYLQQEIRHQNESSRPNNTPTSSTFPLCAPSPTPRALSPELIFSDHDEHPSRARE